MIMISHYYIQPKHCQEIVPVCCALPCECYFVLYKFFSQRPGSYLIGTDFKYLLVCKTTYHDIAVHVSLFIFKHVLLLQYQIGRTN